VRQIKILENSLNIVIVPVWTPREHERIVVADFGSKFSLNSDEWSTNRTVLAGLLQELNFEPQVDCFASQHNAICPVFFSRTADSQAAGRNFFVQPLYPRIRYFCCPPVAMIIPCFRKLMSHSHLSFLLLVPDWPSAAYWPVLFLVDHKYRFTEVRKFATNFFYANLGSSKVFSEKPNFSMLAIVTSGL